MGDGQLAGISVVTLATNLPGPVAAARLTALGADVTKVEPPFGDMAAIISPGMYQQLSAGQRIVALDLKAPDGMADLHALLDAADVLLTSHRPSSLQRLGLDWPALTARHPRLSQVAIVGEPGAGAERPGHDLTYQAQNGLVDGDRMPRSPFADLMGGERAATAVLAAVADLRLHGRTSYCEMALSDVAADLAIPYHQGATKADGVLGGGLPVYGIYATQDGFVAVAALEPHFQERLAAALSVELTRAALEECFAARTDAEWVRWAAEYDIPLSPVVD